MMSCLSWLCKINLLPTLVLNQSDANKKLAKQIMHSKSSPYFLEGIQLHKSTPICCCIKYLNMILRVFVVMALVAMTRATFLCPWCPACFQCPRPHCPTPYCPQRSCPSLPQIQNLTCPKKSCPQMECPTPSCPTPQCPKPQCPATQCPKPECPALTCPKPNCPTPACPARECPKHRCPTHILPCPAPIVITCPEPNCSCPACPQCPPTPRCSIKPRNLPMGYGTASDVGFFKIYEQKKTWSQANLTCSTDGGYVAIPNTPGEFYHLLWMMETHNIDVLHIGYFVNITQLRYPSTSGNIMRECSSNRDLGEHPTDVKNTYESSGREIAQLSPGNKTVNDQNCASIHRKKGRIFIGSCDNLEFFVCEISRS